MDLSANFDGATRCALGLDPEHRQNHDREGEEDAKARL